MAYGTKHQTVDGVKLMGSNLFGTCTTGSSTAAKAVSLDGFDVLVTGVTIHVKFTYANYSSYRTLAVGSTGAVGIRRNGSAYVYWEAGSVISFTYDGEYWQQNDFYDTSGGYDGNTTYTLTNSGRTIYLNPSSGTGTNVSVPMPFQAGQTYGPFAAPTGISEQRGLAIPSYTGYKAIGVIGWNINTANTGGGLSVLRATAVKILDGSGYVQVGNHGNASHNYEVSLNYLYVPI